MPSCSPYSGTSGCSPARSNYSSGSVTLSGGGTWSLAPGSYCFNAFTTSGGSTLVITGPTTINMNGQWNSSGGSVSNTTNDPTNFNLKSAFTGNNCVQLSGGSTSYAHVYAPAGKVVVSSGTGNFYGSITGLSIDASGGTHLDRNRNAGGSTTLANWHEVQN